MPKPRLPGMSIVAKIAPGALPALAAITVLLVHTSAAYADDAEDAVEAAQFTHKGQVGVHVQLGTGYRVLFPYNEEYCGQKSNDGGNKSVCTGRSPFFVDAGLSFGVTHALELLAEVRFGLENDFSDFSGAVEGPKRFSFAAGLRLFVDPDGAFKFFSTIEGVVELTDYSDTTFGSNGEALADSADFGLRNVNGIQLDLHRTFGVYAHFGETVTFSSWLRFELHGGLGVQVRFP